MQPSNDKHTSIGAERYKAKHMVTISEYSPIVQGPGDTKVTPLNQAALDQEQVVKTHWGQVKNVKDKNKTTGIKGKGYITKKCNANSNRNRKERKKKGKKKIQDLDVWYHQKNQ